MYEQCQEDYEQQNMCMYHWQFPLMVLKAEQAQIDELNIKNQRYLGKMQEQQDQIAELKSKVEDALAKVTIYWGFNDDADIVLEMIEKTLKESIQ